MNYQQQLNQAVAQRDALDNLIGKMPADVYNKQADELQTKLAECENEVTRLMELRDEQNKAYDLVAEFRAVCNSHKSQIEIELKTHSHTSDMDGCGNDTDDLLAGMR